MRLLEALACLIISASCAAAACEPWSLMAPGQRESLLQSMARSPDEYALAIRHADKVPADRFEDAPQAYDSHLPDYCSGSTPPLTNQGMRHARSIGEGMGAYGLDPGEVLTSPICRARQTAELAFANENIIVTMDEELRMENEPRKISLRNRINAHTDLGLRVVVSHSLQIRRATGVEPACGETLILEKTHGSRRSQCRARILPDEWTATPQYQASTALWIEPDQCASDAIRVRRD